jgi:hypothetical protein
LWKIKFFHANTILERAGNSVPILFVMVSFILAVCVMMKSLNQLSILKEITSSIDTKSLTLSVFDVKKFN